MLVIFGYHLNSGQGFRFSNKRFTSIRHKCQNFYAFALNRYLKQKLNNSTLIHCVFKYSCCNQIIVYLRSCFVIAKIINIYPQAAKSFSTSFPGLYPMLWKSPGNEVVIFCFKSIKFIRTLRLQIFKK